MTFSVNMRRLSGRVFGDRIARRNAEEFTPQLYEPINCVAVQGWTWSWRSEPPRYPKARTLQGPF